MEKSTGKTYMAIGTIWLAMSLVLFFLSPQVRSVAVTGALTSIILMIAGYGSKNGEDAECDINRRDELMAKSLLPGFVRLRYFKDRMGMVQSLLFILGLVPAIVGASYVFGDADIDVKLTGFMMFLYGLTIVIFSIMWSALDVNDHCNKKGMLYRGGIFEMRWKNTELGMKLLVVITFTSLALLTVGFYLGGILT